MSRYILPLVEPDVADGLPAIPPPGRLWRSLRFWIWTFVVTLVAAAIPDFFVDYWFFESIGQPDVFAVILGVQVALFAVTWVIFCLADYLPIRQYAVSPGLRDAAIHLGGWSGLFAGWVVARSWETFLLWRHRQPFGELDPVFGLDLGFYVFTLPALSALLAILAAAGLDTAVAFLLGRFDQVRSYGLLRRKDLTIWDKAGLMVTPGLNVALGVLGVSLVGTTFLGRYYLPVKADDVSVSTRNRNVPLLSEIEMSPSGSGGLWALVENPLWGFPRSGGRGLCVHGSGRVHRPPRHGPVRASLTTPCWICA